MVVRIKNFSMIVCLLAVFSCFSCHQAYAQDYEVVAKNLRVPWALVFLPDQNILLTERSGRVRLIDKHKGLIEQPVHTLSHVAAQGEGGLLGIDIDPNFDRNHFVYLYYTYKDGSKLLNKVVRFEYKNNQFINETVIVDNIPGSSTHNGGRIKFGPDGYLYIGTGDGAEPELAQDKNSLGGKILRVKDHKVEIYSYGHRNVQGLAWDHQGRLWATEHGQRAYDELNLIKPGKNYGWPEVRGDQQVEGIEPPVIHSGEETWAPSGLAFYNGSLFFAGLRGRTLYEYDLSKKNLKKHFESEFGRLRDVVSGPDGFLYFTTSNHDGRGLPAFSDDRVIKIHKNSLKLNFNSQKDVKSLTKLRGANS